MNASLIIQKGTIQDFEYSISFVLDRFSFYRLHFGRIVMVSGDASASTDRSTRTFLGEKCWRFRHPLAVMLAIALMTILICGLVLLIIKNNRRSGSKPSLQTTQLNPFSTVRPPTTKASISSTLSTYSSSSTTSTHGLVPSPLTNTQSQLKIIPSYRSLFLIHCRSWSFVNNHHVFKHNFSRHNCCNRNQ